jgi:hypothetical protein
MNTNYMPKLLFTLFLGINISYANDLLTKCEIINSGTKFEGKTIGFTTSFAKITNIPSTKLIGNEVSIPSKNISVVYNGNGQVQTITVNNISTENQQKFLRLKLINVELASSNTSNTLPPNTLPDQRGYNWEGELVLQDYHSDLQAILQEKFRMPRHILCNTAPETENNNEYIEKQIFVRDLPAISPLSDNEVGICYPFRGDNIFRNFRLREGVYSPLFFSYSNMTLLPNEPTTPIFWWKKTGGHYETTYGPVSDIDPNTSARIAMEKMEEMETKTNIYDTIRLTGQDRNTHIFWKFNAIFSIDWPSISGIDQAITSIVTPPDTYFPSRQSLYNTSYSTLAPLKQQHSGYWYPYLALVTYNNIQQFFTCNRAYSTADLPFFSSSYSLKSKQLPVKFENDNPIPLYSNRIPAQTLECDYNDKQVITLTNSGSNTSNIRIVTKNLPNIDARLEPNATDIVAKNHGLFIQLDWIGRPGIRGVARNANQNENWVFFKQYHADPPTLSADSIRANFFDGAMIAAMAHHPTLGAFTLFPTHEFLSGQEPDYPAEIKYKMPQDDNSPYNANFWNLKLNDNVVYKSGWILTLNKQEYKLRCTLKPLGKYWKVDWETGTHSSSQDREKPKDVGDVKTE